MSAVLVREHLTSPKLVSQGVAGVRTVTPLFLFFVFVSGTCSETIDIVT